MASDSKEKSVGQRNVPDEFTHSIPVVDTSGHGPGVNHAVQETVDAPEIADTVRRSEIRRRYKTVPLTIHVPPWQDDFLTDASKIFGRPKSEFVRAACAIIINRIIEKYSATNPEIAKLAESVPTY